MSNVQTSRTPAAKTAAVKEPFVHITKRDYMHPAFAWLIRIAAVVLAMLLCGLLAFAIIDKLRENPQKILEFYRCFYTGSFDPLKKSWKFLGDMVILLGIALALTPAFRMRFWNIGAEGQTLVGVLAAIAVNFYLGGKDSKAAPLVPEWLLLVLMLIAAVSAGALWGFFPALCKVKLGTNETLFTLMMNYVAIYLVGAVLSFWSPTNPNLAKLPYGALPRFGPKDAQAYMFMIIVVAILTALLFVYLYFSKQGYEINVVGESENTARYVGISVGKVAVRTMLLSGMLCGLVGFMIAGKDGSVSDTSVGGQGFTAIMVSWLAKFNPLVMVLTSALIVVLNRGAAQITKTFNIDSSFPNVVVGIILFFIIGSEFFINYQLNFRKKHQSMKEVTVK